MCPEFHALQSVNTGSIPVVALVFPAIGSFALAEKLWASATAQKPSRERRSSGAARGLPAQSGQFVMRGLLHAHEDGQRTIRRDREMHLVRTQRDCRSAGIRVFRFTGSEQCRGVLVLVRTRARPPTRSLPPESSAERNVRRASALPSAVRSRREATAGPPLLRRTRRYQ
jgi:hypothetical protein